MSRLSLNTRLTQQLGARCVAPPPSAAPPPLQSDLTAHARAHERMARWLAPAPGATALTLEEALPGTLHQTDAGPCYVVTTRRDDSHGLLPLAAALTARTDHLSAVVGDPRLAGFDVRRALFLDIEATGLDHGAGTLAFMVGLGHYSADGAFIVRQALLRSPGDERALLLVVREALDAADFLVSFNGKSYDLTVLQNRLVMHGLYGPNRAALKLRPHLDLLHLSKNLYRGRWPDTRLQTLEREVLGLHRTDDIPGHLVPACFFAWLRHADPEPIAEVARHNLDDVLTMAVLTAELAGDADASRPDKSPLLTENLGRVLYRRGHYSSAEALLRPLDRPDALWLRALCARRRRDHRERATALEAMLRHRPRDAEAHAELAIARQRLGDHAAALDAAEAAHRLDPCQTNARRRDRLRARLTRP